MLNLYEIKKNSSIETTILKIIENKSNSSEYDIKYKTLIDFISSEAKKCNINIENVFNKQSDSTKNILEKFKNNNDKKIQTFFKELLVKISIKFPEYSKNIKKLENSEIFESQVNNFYTNFKKELVYTRKDFKTELKFLKEVGNSYYERFKTEVGEVNLNGINSKTIESQFKEYTELLSIMKNELLPIQDKIKNLQKAKTIIIALSATFGITAGGLSIASFFCPALAPIAFSFGIASATCGVVSSVLQGVISRLNSKIAKIIESIKTFEKFNYQWFGLPDVLALGNTFLGATQDLLSYFFPTKIWNGISSGVFSLIQASFDIKSCIDSVEEMRKTIENQKAVYKKTVEINTYLKSIEHVKWSVVDETKQTAPYEKGGIGGKNLKFKNLKTQEIFTLETLLSYSKIKLNLLGLTKVYNSKLKEWYIKTLPNKILIDNLG